MVLVDTSVWIEHLRRANAQLASLLEAGDVVCHPLVIGELACGIGAVAGSHRLWTHDRGLRRIAARLRVARA